MDGGCCLRCSSAAFETAAEVQTQADWSRSGDEADLAIMTKRAREQGRTLEEYQETLLLGRERLETRG